MSGWICIPRNGWNSIFDIYDVINQNYVIFNQLKEPVTLQGSHVIGGDQLLVAALTKMTGGTELKNIYANRENSRMFHGMGDAMKLVKESSPGGMLVFHEGV